MFDTTIANVEPKLMTVSASEQGFANYSLIQYTLENPPDGTTLFVYNGTYADHAVIIPIGSLKMIFRDALPLLHIRENQMIWIPLVPLDE
jgi:hypothetical protein